MVGCKGYVLGWAGYVFCWIYVVSCAWFEVSYTQYVVDCVGYLLGGLRNAVSCPGYMISFKGPEYFYMFLYEMINYKLVIKKPSLPPEEEKKIVYLYLILYLDFLQAFSTKVMETKKISIVQK